MSERNFFKDLVQLDVSEHVEKKGRFSYLSWSWAVDQLKRYDHKVTWRTVEHDGNPYWKTDAGYFVEVEVNIQGIRQSHIHPVLDNQNKPIENPNTFQINNSIQRCLVKAIAGLTGLGLYIYSGEDLPNVETEPITSKQLGELKTLALQFAELRKSGIDKVYEALKISDLTKLSSQDADRAVNQLRTWIDKAAT